MKMNLVYGAKSLVYVSSYIEEYNIDSSPCVLTSALCCSKSCAEGSAGN